jgi:MFS superfamily sulfate permease-like transporter
LAVVVLGGIAVLIAARAGAGLGSGFLLNLPGGQEFFTALPKPDFAVFTDPAVWGVALTIALIASLETLLNVEAIDRMDPAKHKTPSNRELKAQGVGNMVSGLLGGLPITSVIVRSSANLSAGAKSKLSIVIHGVLLLLAVLVLTPLLAWVPLAVLAAVVIMTGYKLASPAVVARALKGGPESSLPFAATLILGVTSNLLIGVAVGTALSLVFLLVRQQRLGPEIEQRGDRLRIVLPEITSFLHRPRLEAALSQVEPGHSVELDLGKLHYCAQEIHQLLTDFLQDSAHRGITVRIKNRNLEASYELK